MRLKLATIIIAQLFSHTVFADDTANILLKVTVPAKIIVNHNTVKIPPATSYEVRKSSYGYTVAAL
ncbi:hypothetical protein EDC56_0212 [Sinobacterium caligoides]|uniref:Uncharacterized protein n=1 Tax=Sinobacterium caligoides TaxID=933926 RepID=A0A3N2DYY0_9GAMM|nr:hypothetical protein EDC56_0212 [Sinobacterium caligoides]